MTKEERDAEIVRLLPYALKYARDFLRKRRKPRIHDAEDVYAEAKLALVCLVDAGKPPQYLKRAIKWALCSYTIRAFRSRREIVFSDFAEDAGLENGNNRELSFVSATADDDDARRVLFSLFRAAVMRETHDCPFSIRAALRACLLQGRVDAWRNSGYSSEAFYGYRRRVFVKIKKKITKSRRYSSIVVNRKIFSPNRKEHR